MNIMSMQCSNMIYSICDWPSSSMSFTIPWAAMFACFLEMLSVVNMLGGYLLFSVYKKVICHPFIRTCLLHCKEFYLKLCLIVVYFFFVHGKVIYYPFIRNYLLHYWYGSSPR